MSKAVAVVWHVTAAEVEQRNRAERDVGQGQRLRARLRVRTGDRVADAGLLVGLGERTVFRWRGWERRRGSTVCLDERQGAGRSGSALA
jgi:hypothetical protein